MFISVVLYFSSTLLNIHHTTNNHTTNITPPPSTIFFIGLLIGLTISNITPKWISSPHEPLQPPRTTNTNTTPMYHRFHFHCCEYYSATIGIIFEVLVFQLRLKFRNLVGFRWNWLTFSSIVVLSYHCYRSKIIWSHKWTKWRNRQFYVLQPYRQQRPSEVVCRAIIYSDQNLISNAFALCMHACMHVYGYVCLHVFMHIHVGLRIKVLNVVNFLCTAYLKVFCFSGVCPASQCSAIGFLTKHASLSKRVLSAIFSGNPHRESSTKLLV